MLFAQYGQCILVAHERASRFTFIERPQDRKADRTARPLAALLQPLPSSLRRSIAFDNGPEFARHHQLSKQVDIQTFFCDVRSPWQKVGGANALGTPRTSHPTTSTHHPSTQQAPHPP